MIILNSLQDQLKLANRLCKEEDQDKVDKIVSFVLKKADDLNYILEAYLPQVIPHQTRLKNTFKFDEETAPFGTYARLTKQLTSKDAENYAVKKYIIYKGILKFLKDKELTLAFRTNPKAVALDTLMLDFFNKYMTDQREKFISTYRTHFEIVFKNTEKLPIMLSEHKSWLTQNYVNPITLAKQELVSSLTEFQESSLSHLKDLHQPNQILESWLSTQADKWLERTSFYKDYLDSPLLSLSKWLDQQKILKFEKEKRSKKLETIDDMFEAFSDLSQKTD